MAARITRLPEVQRIKAAKQAPVFLRIRLRLYPTNHPGLLRLMEQHSGADLVTIIPYLAELGLSRLQSSPTEAPGQPAGARAGGPVDGAVATPGSSAAPRASVPSRQPETPPELLTPSPERVNQLVEASEFLATLGTLSGQTGTQPN